MHRKEKIDFIIKTLNKCFPNPKIPLNYTNPYTLLIAVLLSAQTTDKCVNKITKILFKKANTPKTMINLSYDELLKIIKPCGLGPTKAKAIISLSKIIIEKYKGKVPKTFKYLESLPGVGHKTASVVMITAFNKDAFPVDTHIARSARRWKLSKSKKIEQIEKDLKKLFPKKLWKKLHLQIIYFARKYCPARSHKIEQCPICSKIK